jgi:predicted PolB exonuclease-like 3'-5' exonuclease
VFGRTPFYNLMTPILVFDIETIPDVAGIRRLEDLPAT